MRSAPLAPVLMLLALVGLAVCGVILSGVFSPVDGGLPMPVGEAALDGSEQAGAPLASGPPTVEETDPSEAAKPASERLEVTTEEAPALVLRIVERATGGPCPGAEVRLGDLGKLRQRHGEVDGKPYHHICQLAERHGIVLRADDQGVVRMAPIESRHVAAVTHEDLFATTTLRPGSAEVRIELAPDETLRLRVESSGTPTPDVPIAVFQGNKPNKGRRLWSGTTAAEGDATIPHFQLLRRSERSGKRFAAAFGFPVYRGPGFRGLAGSEFEGRPVPAEPVVLEMPPMGSIKVIVTDLEGRPVAGRVGATLRVVRDKKMPPIDLPLSKDHDKLRIERAEGEEAVLFPFIGLGLQFEVSPFFADDNTTWKGQRIFGPSYPGEVVTVRQQMRTDLVVLAGRLVDAEGSPLGEGTRPNLQLLGRGRTVVRPRSRTLAVDGGFTVSGYMRDVTGPFALEATVKVDDQTLGARVELAQLSGGACHEIGEIRMVPLPPIASGVVVDDRGEPVNRARVYIQALRVASARTGKQSWKSDGFASVRTDATGRFAMYGHPAGQRLRLRATASRHVSVTTPDIEPGAELTLTLARSGVLEGDVLVPDWLPSKAITMRLKEHGSKSSRTTRLTNRKGHARFRFSSLKPGVYDAVFELRNMNRPVLVIPGVAVAPGSSGKEGRLRQVDLRSGLFLYELRAVGADGVPVRSTRGGVFGRVVGRDGSWETVGFRWKGGKVRLIHTSPTMDLTFLVHGRQRMQIIVEAGTRDVALPKMAPVRVRLPGLRELVGDLRVYVSVGVDQAAGLPKKLRSYDQWSTRSYTMSGSSLLTSTGVWLAATREDASVKLTHPGRHKVSVRLHPPQGRKLKVKTISRSVGTFELAAGTREVTLPLNAGALRAAVAEMRAAMAQPR